MVDVIIGTGYIFCNHASNKKESDAQCIIITARCAVKN